MRIIRIIDGLRVSLYPNPFTDILTIEIASDQAARSSDLLFSKNENNPYTVQLWNENHGCVRTFIITNSVQQLSLQDLPFGMYIVLIMKEGKTLQRQIIWKS